MLGKNIRQNERVREWQESSHNGFIPKGQDVIHQEDEEKAKIPP